MRKRQFSPGLLTLILIVILTALPASAEYRFRDGEKMEIQWYEQEGRILNEHVCFNYQENVRKYRQCRRKAVDYFDSECRHYNEKVEQTSEKYKQIYEPERDKFCAASETYRP